MKKSSLISQANQLLDSGQYFLALDLLLPALDSWPKDRLLQQLAAKGLIRVGAERRAEQLLGPLAGQNPSDEESIGLLARIYKNRWLQTGDPADARRARDAYLRGQASGGYYTLINAATLSRILGEHALAESLAQQVVALCRQAQEANPYWALASLGEALLLLDQPEAALAAYGEAIAHAGRRYSLRVSSLQQLQLMANHGIEVPAELFDWLKPPTLLIFTGHMIDAPERQPPRFPAALEPAVSAAMDAELERLDARIGFGSAACGADILFAERLLARGGELNLVLPFNLDEFIRTSVAFAGDHWVERLQRLLPQANLRYATRELYLQDDLLFAYTNRIISGYALLRAELLATQPSLLALVDGASRSKTGGALSFVSSWPFAERLHRIDLATLRASTPLPAISTIPTQVPETPAAQPERQGYSRQIKALLFADFVGFSKLRDEQAPVFVNQLLAEVSQRLRPVTPADAFLNTWGDAIFAVMDNACQIATYALTLSDAVREESDNCTELDTPIGIRIALNAGPVFEMQDQITGKQNFYGFHVNRTARLEPITEGGRVFATEQFAALLIAEQAEQGQSEFHCEYLGALSFAKAFGSEPVYAIRRKSEQQR
ncbi:MAG: hypothetical protein H7842_06430 [Gammaproteobacteria bacterium SHHR-1]